MRFVADLHIHSRFSRATSRELDPERLHLWAQRKGLTVVGTGDVTHPAWRAELRERLRPAEDGLWRLAPERARVVDAEVPVACRGPVRFLLSAEISTIFKRGDRVRKVHHVVLLPSWAAVDRLVGALEPVGKLGSDGRPTLGLDARDLLGMVLDARGVLIPAHIWTPWFSVLGSRSGFDSIDECYGDLAPHVFAAETGLSSDPAMNWRVSALDRYTLVSNSDAHSPVKLGREATLFNVPLGYDAIIGALRTREGFGGTIEIHPEEGKYHVDGHRRCGVRLVPAETRARGGRCPECGRPVTVGVLHRVEELADRPAGHVPEGAPLFERLVPLDEVAGEVLGVGPKARRVATLVEHLLQELGPELAVLREVPCEDIERVGGARLADAITRMRTGRFAVIPGYDGEYGRVSLLGGKP